MIRRITSRQELVELAGELRVRSDWHEPDEQGVTASVYGDTFDNAGFWPQNRGSAYVYDEKYVTIKKDGIAVADVNLATLFAWATGLEK